MAEKIGTTDAASSLLHIDELKMYFREPLALNSKITLYQPTIGDIVEFGEKEYYSVVHSLSCIPSDMKSQLEDMGIDYMEISDYELFIMLTRGLKKEDTVLLLGDLDLSKFAIYEDTNVKDIVLYDEENDIRIDRLMYMKIAEYVRKLHGIKPKIEKAANKTTKRILIQLDRDRIAKAQKEGYKSQLKPLISAMMRYPGFKYKSTELKQCGLYEFMDTIQGAQIYVSSTALLQGSYSGMLDLSKVNRKEFNWLRSLDE